MNIRYLENTNSIVEYMTKKYKSYLSYEVIYLSGNFLYTKKQIKNKLKLHNINIANRLTSKINCIFIGNNASLNKISTAKELNITIREKEELYGFLEYLCISN